MRAAPKSDAKIIINDVPSSISHLNLGLPNITWLKNNMRTVMPLIGCQRKWSRSATFLRWENDHLRFYELSHLLHTSA
jgi:hypothetical protein